MPRKPLPGTGAWADRELLLEAVRQVAPKVLVELRDLLHPGRVELLGCYDRSFLPPSNEQAAPFDLEPWAWDGPADLAAAAALNADVHGWAAKWNLARAGDGVGRGEWVLHTAARTLWHWARRLRSGEPSLAPDPARLDWTYKAWGYYSAPDSKDPILFASHSHYLARDKRQMGGGRALLRTVEGWRLLAFVRWQVLGEGCVRLRKAWPGYQPRRAVSRMVKTGERKRDPEGAAHSDRAIAEAMEALRVYLDLPRRNPGKAGRPRADR